MLKRAWLKLRLHGARRHRRSLESRIRAVRDELDVLKHNYESQSIAHRAGLEEELELLQDEWQMELLRIEKLQGQLRQLERRGSR